ncbi:hypothetical protein [Chryseobacterium sp. 2VB]|uniref:hypothetical protein n=1 Tax=Chryseobacterium sp. 2VB TaxID=2502204 RepID=UPI0010F56386|nr:hypothetical protein [Chryseobacterium sp. 2VB]
MEDSTNTQNPDPSSLNTLLVFNPKTQKIEAVKTVDEKGNLMTVPNTQKNQNQFLKIDKQGDLFSNFFSNFLSQLKNPTSFNFFTSPLKESEKIGKQIEHHLKHSSGEGEEFLKTYTIPENKMMLAIYLAAPEVENDRRALNTFYGMRRAQK